ncbi:MAG: hypothetical protein JNK76_22985 [Planctomycetales bacterium]|nr:hypothetical protein [Planctomycetales bacterium]MBN8626785.1 hypothetical protein [Planctomycetota bacterium]
MRIDEFDAPYHEIDIPARFLGFANNESEKYLWFQRDEEFEGDPLLPNAGNVWVERDDQAWDGHGGIAGVVLTRTTLTVVFTPEATEYMGGYEEIRISVALNDAAYSAVREQLFRVFVGYEMLLRIE